MTTASNSISPLTSSTGRSTIFLALFALVLASQAARNVDLLLALANGRDLLAGTVRPATGWLFEVAVFGLFRACGEWSLVAAKAAAMALVAVLLVRFRSGFGGWATTLIVGLAVLAMNHRTPVGPTVVSLLLFALLLRRDSLAAEQIGPRAFDWRSLLGIAVWANMHDWWMIGVAALLAIDIGRKLDSGRSGMPPGWLAMLARPAAGCLSSFPFEGSKLSTNLGWLFGRTDATGLESFAARIHSPFSEAFRTIFLETPAVLAFYLLLSLGIATFLVSIRSWSWARVLPFATLAGLSSLEARLIPLFAVFAPVAIFGNLAAKRDNSAPPRRSILLNIAGTLTAGAFLLAAWPGWLQSKPFEPRSWRFLPPADIVAGAQAYCDTQPDRLPGGKTLHLVRETHAAFRWHCPGDPGVIDDRAIDSLLAPAERLAEADQLLDELGIDRVVVRGGDALCDLHLARLAIRTDRWQLTGTGGGIAVFSRRVPSASAAIDLDRIALHPAPESLPPLDPPLPGDESFVRRHIWASPPVASASRDEARLLLKLVESEGVSAPIRHLQAWETSQAVGLIGGVNPAIGHLITAAALRGHLFRPALPDDDPFAKAGPPAFSRLVFAMQQRFAADRGHVTPGRVYAAIQAARNAVAESPNDSLAHLLLARAYQALPQHTMEQRWAARLPRIARLRNVQASAAYNRAVLLNPDLAEAHYELGQLYQGAGCFDLAVNHLKSWRELEILRLRLGGDRSRLEKIEPILERMEREVARQLEAFEKESARISVGDRAADAVRRGLGGTARDLLLKSDVSAFGRIGTEIEVDFLLRTGRPRDVLEWLDPDVQGTLGAFPYRWSRAQARAALGQYAPAREELAAALGDAGDLPTPESVRRRAGELLGVALMDEIANRGQLPQWLLYTLRHSDFFNHMLDIESTLGRECEMAVLDGLLAFESGRMDDARSRFASVVAFAPRRGASGQLNAPAVEIAREALQLLDPLQGK